MKRRQTAHLDVIGFGTNAVDHLICVPRFPEFDSKLEIDSHVVSAGGEVASTLVGLQRLGARTSYIGSFGDDPAGELGLRSLKDEGIDTTHCRKVVGADTQVAYILIDSASGERTVLWKRDPALGFKAEEAPIEIAGAAKVLHLTPHDTAACIRMSEHAAAAGTIVSADIDKVFTGIEELLPNVDICLATAEFIEHFAGRQNLRTGLKQLSKNFEIAIVGVTLGAAGSLLIYENMFVETPAFPVPGGCVDTTGAGDAFRAGFLHGVLNGAGMQDCAILANAVAALKCSKMGARGGLPDRETLLQFLDQKGHRSIAV